MTVLRLRIDRRSLQASKIRVVSPHSRQKETVYEDLLWLVWDEVTVRPALTDLGLCVQKRGQDDAGIRSLPTRNFHDPPPFLPWYMGLRHARDIGSPAPPLFSRALKRLGNLGTRLMQHNQHWAGLWVMPPSSLQTCITAMCPYSCQIILCRQ